MISQGYYFIRICNISSAYKSILGICFDIKKPKVRFYVPTLGLIIDKYLTTIWKCWQWLFVN
ncbi:MAG: hypothetical protein ACI8P3_003341 [Saprospiraceae bacterium]|jgi:hypothetical protein